MAVEVVRRCTVRSGGVLGCAFKAAFRHELGQELQLTFSGQRVKVKDVLELSPQVERVRGVHANALTTATVIQLQTRQSIC